MVELKELKEMIESEPVALATLSETGDPYVITVAEVRVIEEDKLLITDNYMRKTRENIVRSGKVALVVWDKEMNGHNMTGTAKYFTEGKYVEQVKAMKENKGLPAKGAIVVTVVKIKESA